MLMPLTLKLYVEAVSVAGVTRFITEVPAPETVGGRNHPFTPVGRLVPLRVTVPVKPCRAVTVTVYVPVPPATTDDEDERAMLKSGAGVTTRLAVPECVSVPLVPVTVRVEVAATVAVVVVMVRVEDPEAIAEKLAVAPLGSPVAARVTVPVKPLFAVMVTKYVVEAPATTVCGELLTARVKSGVLPVFIGVGDEEPPPQALKNVNNVTTAETRARRDQRMSFSVSFFPGSI